jgi:hypothetical protein
LVAILVAILVAFEAFRSAVVLNTISSVFDHDRDATFEIPTVWSKSPVLCDSHKSPQELSSVLPSKKITIAYATSITAYDPKQTSTQLIDRAAVLHQSIRLAAQKSPKYDYHMYAFVHPDASGCVPILQSLGYQTQIRETPFNVSMIKNENLRIAQGNGCCGEKVSLQATAKNAVDCECYFISHRHLTTSIFECWP